MQMLTLKIDRYEDYAQMGRYVHVSKQSIPIAELSALSSCLIARLCFLKKEY